MRTLYQKVQKATNYVLADGMFDLSFETQDYGIAVGFESKESETAERLSYLVVNKKTGVVEHSTFVLPNAIALQQETQRALDTNTQAVRSTEAPPPRAN